jgi:hypothetical protein
MKKLGEILVEREWATREQVYQALKHQQVFGGRLGTCLLELSLVAEDRLVRALSEQLGVPAVSADDLRVIGDGILEVVPKKLACRSRVVPFERFGNSISVALVDTRDLLLQDELGFVVSKRLKIHVAPEVRVLEALEKHYGCAADPRFSRIWDRLNRARFLWQEEAPAAAAASAAPAARPASAPSAAPAPQVGGLGGPSWEPAPPPPLESGVTRLAAAGVSTTESRPAPRALPPPPPPAREEMPAAPAPRLAPAPAPPPLRPLAPAAERHQPEPVTAPPGPVARRAPEAVGAPPAADASPPSTLPRTRTTDGVPPPAPTPSPLRDRAATPPPAPAAVAAPAAPVAAMEVAPAERAAAAPKSGAAADEGAETSPLVVPRAPETVEELETRLADVEERDDAAHAVLSLLERRFVRRVLFMVRGNEVAAWMGSGEGVDQGRLAGFEVSFDEPSLFLNLREGSPFYRGPLPRLDSHQRLVRLWGGRYPRECLMLPVRVKGRMVAVVYCDRANAGFGGLDIEELLQVAAAMGRGLERYLLSRKRQGG